jgi:predicted metal-dependent hydrolase
MVAVPPGRPLAYAVRVSSRARHVRLQVSARDGLLVVVPRRFDQSRLEALVESRRDWIERAVSRVGLPIEVEPLQLPEWIELASLGERWEVRYSGPRDSATVACRERCGGRLLVSSQDPLAASVALQRWLSRRARAALVPQLLELAVERGLTVTAVSIRAQRSRWASCSAKGSVSLNRNLAFLPPRLTEVVLLHELCHLSEMNHGPGFWALLAAEVPELAERQAELHQAWRHVPRWAL